MTETLKDLPQTDARVRREAFRAILQGSPVSARELAPRTRIPEGDVEVSLRRQAGRGMARLDEAGRVVGAGGLSLEPTRHRLRMPGADLHTWCAIDAVGIPAALGKDASVATPCGYCGRTIEIELRAGHLTTLPAPVAWLPSKSFSSVADEMCPEMNLFCDEAHLRTWRAHAGDPEGRMLALHEVEELGRGWWAGMGEGRDEEDHPCC